jgi:hypothetical protein
VPVTRTQPTRRLRPGDLICGECGEGNRPARKFCGRCGEPLLLAETVRTPWWRALIPRRGPRTVVLAGEPRLGSTGGSGRKAGRDLGQGMRKLYRMVRLGMGLALLGAGLVYGVYPPFRDTVNSEFAAVKQKLSSEASRGLVPVHPVKVTVNLQAAGHRGADAVDGFTSTYWLARWNPGHAPVLTLHFGRRVTLERMVLISGASGNFTAAGRPATLDLIFSNDESGIVVPQDTPKPQTLRISHAALITSVQIQIGSVYPGLSGSKVAIRDIELFALPLPS